MVGFVLMQEKPWHMGDMILVLKYCDVLLPHDNPFEYGEVGGSITGDVWCGMSYMNIGCSWSYAGWDGGACIVIGG